MKKTQREALKELKAVMKKHGISISWDCSPYSDTHGISGEKMVISVGGEKVLDVEYTSTLAASDI